MRLDMSEIILKNINKNLETEGETLADKNELSPSTFLVQNNDEENIENNEGVRHTEKPSETNYEGIQTSQKLNMANADDSNTASVTWQKLLQINKKRQSMISKFKEASKCMKPCEFESYHEFFVLNTFKKGISASGHVNIKDVKRNHAKRRFRSKRIHNVAIRVPITPSGSSTTLNSEDGEGEELEEVLSNEDLSEEVVIGEANLHSAIGVSTTPLSTTPKDEGNSERQSTKINCNISMSSIIPGPESAGFGRRSTRLLKKGQRGEEAANYDADVANNEIGGDILVKDLYESLVPKVKEPYRRSDWILPSRLRYTPDKQMHTKFEYEKINLNELVSTGKIQRVLSKFEGGITGVRKSGWNSVK